jgi:hypothetical protein
MNGTPTKVRTARAVGLWLVPFATVGIAGLSFYAGASESYLAAVVSGRAPSHGRMAMQVVVFEERDGVRNRVESKELEVTTKLGPTARVTRVTTDAHGVAEIEFAADDQRFLTDQSVDITVRDPRNGNVLAEGSHRFTTGPLPVISEAAREALSSSSVGPRPRVVVPGGKAIADFPSDVFVTPADVRVDDDPCFERLSPPKEMPGCPGVATMRIVPRSHVCSLTMTSGGPGAEVASTIALPIAFGAPGIQAPRAIEVGKPFTVAVEAPLATGAVYIELDDRQGRPFAAVASLVKDRFASKAQVTIPGLGPGLAWVVASKDERGAESLGGITTTYAPIRVGPADDDLPPVAPPFGCPELRDRLQRPHGGFVRETVADGAERARVRMGRRSTSARLVAIVGVLTGGALELLLVGIAVGGGRRDAASLERYGIRVQRSGIAVAVLLTVLGFLMLAALALVRTRG